jgi:hypothetical protein
MKKICFFILIVCILLCGCEHDFSLKSVTSKNFYSDCITDYTIKKTNEKTDVSIIDSKIFKKIMNHIDVYANLNSKLFTITELKKISKFKSICFKEIILEGEKEYYCVFSNKENTNRLYLFFYQLSVNYDENITWNCCEYLYTNRNNGVKVLREKGNDLKSFIDPIDF